MNVAKELPSAVTNDVIVVPMIPFDYSVLGLAEVMRPSAMKAKNDSWRIDNSTQKGGDTGIMNEFAN
ncbi:MAG: hypothetical protein EZS28_036618 [Streblomastix strix]|uniref:Uncharacterized protein n=1 Tax=Streblomastix strix TaxID=222440 RepID=A0A5J4UE31_9EUKA|nr:MAG: hypothetical protein EZS28_036618 [Streblomastix strix]